MRKLILLCTAIFIASFTAAFGQEELRPSTDPTFERATMTIHPIWDHDGEVAIDGEANEGFWAQIEPLELLQDVTMAWWSEGSKPVDPKYKDEGDYHVSWKVTMDDDYFYMFAEIIDDNLQSRSMNVTEDSWLNDNLELFFLFADETVVMPDWALSDASQLRIYVDLNELTGDTLEAGGWAAGAIGEDKYRPFGYSSKTVATDVGFNVEARIPWDIIVPSNEEGELGFYDDDDNFIPFDPRALEIFQFDIMGSDRDEGKTHPEGEARHFFANWSANWSRNWGFTEGYGMVTVGDPITTGDPGGVPEEARPTTDPRFERATATIRPIGHYTGEITIDGKDDEGFWDKIDPMNLQFDVTDAWFTNDMKDIDPEIAASGDYDLTWKMTFDDDYFYIFTDVVDDVLVSRSMVSGEDAWVNDNLELFFLFADESMVMPDWALGEASQVRVWADLDPVTADTVTAGGWAGGMIANEGMMNYSSRTVKTDNGYTIETRIPLGLIVPTFEGEYGYFDDDDNFIPIVISELEIFQFDIQVADRDDPAAGGLRKYLHQWSATWNRNWGFTEGYGMLSVGAPLYTDPDEVPEEARPTTDPRFERATATIRPIGDYPGEITIDGKADEGFWDKIESMNLQFDVTDAWFTNDMKEIDPEIAASGDYDLTWKMTFDDDYFYIFTDVVDDVLVSRSMVSGEDAWINDNLELFFLFADESMVMPDWALGEASQVRVWADLDPVTADTVTAGGWAGGMIANEGMMNYSSRTVKTDNGYTMETRIPLGLIVPTFEGEYGYFDDDDNFIPIVISELEIFQFDIQVADRDDPAAGGLRKYLHQWSATWNRNWGFTEGYGMVSVGSPLYDDVSATPSRTRPLKIYPNPASSQITIANLEGNNLISIHNLIGQEMFSVKTSDSQIHVNIGSLQNGVYLMRMISDDGSVKVEKFLKR